MDNKTRLTDVKTLRKRIRQHIEEGVVTSGRQDVPLRLGAKPPAAVE